MRDDAGLSLLRDDWIDLQSRALRPTPYASYDWISLCWQLHRPDSRKRPHIITARHRGRLVLAVPFLARRLPIGLSIVSWIDSQTPFYSDILLEDSAVGLAATRLAAAALLGDRGILRMRLNLVPQDAAAQHLLVHLRARLKSSSPVGSMDLGRFAGRSDFLRSLSQNLRRDFTRTQKLLSQLGRVEIGVAQSVDQIRPALAWLFSAKAQRLERQGRLGSWFRDPRTALLFTSACEMGLSTGACKLFLLELNDTLVAAELVFVTDGVYYLSKSMYDDGLPKSSPGTLLRLSVIMDAIDNGARHVDFMLGTYPWKQRMQTSTRAVGSYRIDGYLLSHLRWRR